MRKKEGKKAVREDKMRKEGNMLALQMKRKNKGRKTMGNLL